MTNNPLLQKYDELYGKQEEPKPPSPPKYSRDVMAILEFEELLQELTTGRAVFLDSKTEPNYRHYDAREDFKHYINGSNLEPQMPLRIDEGDKITLTIFRKCR
jgi:hypothetical protein